MNLPSLNTDQWIQVGMLATATLTLIGGAFAGLKAWHKHRRKVNVRVKQVPRAPVHIHGLAFPDNEPPAVRSVGIWVEVEIHNYSENPILITGIENTNGEDAPEPIIAWPVKEVSYESKEPEVSGIVDFPLRLETQSGTKFFVLSKVKITKPIGELLFKVYGKIDSKKLRQAAERMAAEVTASLSPEIAKVGFQMSPMMMAIQGMNAPLLRKVDGKLVFESKFGTLPAGAGFEIMAHDPKSTPILLNAVALQHSIEIILGDKKRITQRLTTKRNALWMLEKMTG